MITGEFMDSHLLTSTEGQPWALLLLCTYSTETIIQGHFSETLGGYEEAGKDDVAHAMKELIGVLELYVAYNYLAI